MNTLLHLWIEPLIKDHKRSQDKIYVNAIIEGYFSEMSNDELENIVEKSHMGDIMDFVNIDSNWNWGLLWAKATTKPLSIFLVDSPEENAKKAETKKIEKALQKIVSSKKDIPLTKENVEIQDGGKINVSLPALRIQDTIDFSAIWQSLEKNFIGKINKGDSVTLTDDDGNKIFEMTGGDFLNVGVADLCVYDHSKIQNNPSFIDKQNAIKGGLFLREDGRLDVGDAGRTFSLTIYTNNLLKASLKLKKSLMDITRQKLLTWSS